MDLRGYCQTVSKFVSMDSVSIKELFFYQVLDQNQDRLVCETDLFNVVAIIQSLEVADLLADDILVCMRAIEKLRSYRGKNDDITIRTEQAFKNAN